MCNGAIKALWCVVQGCQALMKTKFHDHYSFCRHTQHSHADCLDNKGMAASRISTKDQLTLLSGSLKARVSV